MATVARCQVCGACWAGIEGLATDAVCCFDCLSRKTPWRVRRGPVVLAVAAALASCAGACLLLPSRSGLPIAPPADQTQQVVSTDTTDTTECETRAEPVIRATVSPVSPGVTPKAPPSETTVREDLRPLPVPPVLEVEKKVAQAEPKEIVPAPVAKEIEGRRTLSERDLLQELASAPEIGLGTTAETVVASYLTTIRENLQRNGSPGFQDPTPLIRVRPDLRAISLRSGTSCQLKLADAATLDMLSRKLRAYLNRTATPDGRPRPPASIDALRQGLMSEHRGAQHEWLRPAAIPTLMQLLAHEEAQVRRLLIELLAEIPGAEATTALAQRAVFELDAEVRRATIEALRKRPIELSRPMFLRAFRYPWGAVADHAAEALVDLADVKAVPQLVALLSQPDPTAPEKLPNGRTVVRDVVRVNHLTNCLMCHPPSYDTANVVGVDPVLSIRLTVPRASSMTRWPPPQVKAPRPLAPAARFIQAVPTTTPIAP